MAPVFITGAELVFDEEASEAGAVYEQLALDGASVGKRDRPDVAAFTVDCHIDDLALDTLHAVTFGVRAEEARIEPCVEMIGVSDLRERHRRLRIWPPEPAKLCGDAAHRPFANVRHCAPLRFAKVELVELDSAEILPVWAERVKVAVPLPAPADELDAELERALARGEELILVDADHVVERL